MPLFRRRRRRRLSPQARFLVWAAGFIVLVMVAAGAIAAVRMVSIARDLREARTLITTASAEIEQNELASARERLAAASVILTDANNKLYSSPELGFVSWAPVVSSNLEALRDGVGHALTLVSGGSRLLELAAPLENDEGRLEIPLEAGRVPVTVLSEVSAEVQSLLSVLPGQGERPGGPLFGPVRELQDTVYDEAEEQRTHLLGLSRALRLVSDMAGDGGPRRYLLAVANTAEMRGTGGMVLSYGVLESQGGQFELASFGPIDELFLRNPPDPSVVPIAADEAARWTGLEPTRLFRNANLTPDFQIAGPRLEAMYEVASGLEADGVIQIDVHGLAAILRGIGPIEVPEVGTITAENIVDLALNRLYLDFPDEVTQRREILGEIAEAVFIRLTSGDFGSLRALGTALVDTTNQRHIMFYASTQEASSVVGELGIDGALLDPRVLDSFMLTVQNLGRDKLDYYLDTQVEITGTREAEAFSQLDVTVTVTNNAPVGVDAPSYIFGTPGPDGRGDIPAGTYAGVASFYVPTNTNLLGFEGEGAPGTQPQLTTENDRTVVGFDLRVPAGESRSVTLTLELPPRPPGGYGMALRPAPRVRPTTWLIEVGDGDGRTVRREGPLLTPEGVSAEP